MQVRHKAYGEGIVVNISETIIEVDFGGQLKKFQFPKAFELFLSTDDPILQDKVSVAKEKAKAELKAKDAKQTPEPQIKPVSLQKTASRKLSYAYKSGRNSPLVGDRAQTILVRSEAEMFEIVGYMASPG